MVETNPLSDFYKAQLGVPTSNQSETPILKDSGGNYLQAPSVLPRTLTNAASSALKFVENSLSSPTDSLKYSTDYIRKSGLLTPEQQQKLDEGVSKYNQADSGKKVGKFLNPLRQHIDNSDSGIYEAVNKQKMAQESAKDPTFANSLIQHLRYGSLADVGSAAPTLAASILSPMLGAGYAGLDALNENIHEAAEQGADKVSPAQLLGKLAVDVPLNALGAGLPVSKVLKTTPTNTFLADQALQGGLSALQGGLDNSIDRHNLDGFGAGAGAGLGDLGSFAPLAAAHSLHAIKPAINNLIKPASKVVSEGIANKGTENAGANFLDGADDSLFENLAKEGATTPEIPDLSQELPTKPEDLPEAPQPVPTENVTPENGINTFKEADESQLNNTQPNLNTPEVSQAEQENPELAKDLVTDNQQVIQHNQNIENLSNQFENNTNQVEVGKQLANTLLEHNNIQDEFAKNNQQVPNEFLDAKQKLRNIIDTASEKGITPSPIRAREVANEINPIPLYSVTKQPNELAGINALKQLRDSLKQAEERTHSEYGNDPELNNKGIFASNNEYKSVGEHINDILGLLKERQNDFKVKRFAKTQPIQENYNKIQFIIDHLKHLEAAQKSKALHYKDIEKYPSRDKLYLDSNAVSTIAEPEYKATPRLLKQITKEGDFLHGSNKVLHDYLNKYHGHEGFDTSYNLHHNEVDKNFTNEFKAPSKENTQQLNKEDNKEPISKKSLETSNTTPNQVDNKTNPKEDTQTETKENKTTEKVPEKLSDNVTDVKQTETPLASSQKIKKYTQTSKSKSDSKLNEIKDQLDRGEEVHALGSTPFGQQLSKMFPDNSNLHLHFDRRQNIQVGKGNTPHIHNTTDEEVYNNKILNSLVTDHLNDWMPENSSNEIISKAVTPEIKHAEQLDLENYSKEAETKQKEQSNLISNKEIAKDIEDKTPIKDVSAIVEPKENLDNSDPSYAINFHSNFKIKGKTNIGYFSLNKESNPEGLDILSPLEESLTKGADPIKAKNISSKLKVMEDKIFDISHKYITLLNRFPKRGTEFRDETGKVIGLEQIGLMSTALIHTLNHVGATYFTLPENETLARDELNKVNALSKEGALITVNDLLNKVITKSIRYLEAQPNKDIPELELTKPFEDFARHFLFETKQDNFGLKRTELTINGEKTNFVIIPNEFMNMEDHPGLYTGLPSDVLDRQFSPFENPQYDTKPMPVTPVQGETLASIKARKTLNKLEFHKSGAYHGLIHAIGMNRLGEILIPKTKKISGELGKYYKAAKDQADAKRRNFLAAFTHLLDTEHNPTLNYSHELQAQGRIRQGGVLNPQQNKIIRYARSINRILIDNTNRNDESRLVALGTLVGVSFDKMSKEEGLEKLNQWLEEHKELGTFFKENPNLVTHPDENPEELRKAIENNSPSTHNLEEPNHNYKGFMDYIQKHFDLENEPELLYGLLEAGQHLSGHNYISNLTQEFDGRLNGLFQRALNFFNEDELGSKSFTSALEHLSDTGFDFLGEDQEKEASTNGFSSNGTGLFKPKVDPYVKLGNHLKNILTSYAKSPRQALANIRDVVGFKKDGELVGNPTKFEKYEAKRANYVAKQTLSALNNIFNDPKAVRNLAKRPSTHQLYGANYAKIFNAIMKDAHDEFLHQIQLSKSERLDDKSLKSLQFLYDNIGTNSLSSKDFKGNLKDFKEHYKTTGGSKINTANWFGLTDQRRSLNFLDAPSARKIAAVTVGATALSQLARIAQDEKLKEIKERIAKDPNRDIKSGLTLAEKDEVYHAGDEWNPRLGNGITSSQSEKVAFEPLPETGVYNLYNGQKHHQSQKFLRPIEGGAQPLINQALGDATNVNVIYASDKEATRSSVPIFDASLNKPEKAADAAKEWNRIAIETMAESPLGELREQLDNLTPDMLKKIQDDEGAPVTLWDKVQEAKASIDDVQKWIKARQDIFNEYSWQNNQFSFGQDSAYFHKGEKTLPNDPEERKAVIANAIMEKLGVTHTLNERATSLKKKLGIKDSSIPISGAKFFDKLVPTTTSENEIYKTLKTHFGKIGFPDFHIGTVEELNKAAGTDLFTGLDEGDIPHGVYDPASNKIYISDTAKGTDVIHEMIHYATMKALEEHLVDVSEASTPKQLAAEYILNASHDLLNNFGDYEKLVNTKSQQESLNNLRNVLESIRNKEPELSHRSALQMANEYLAYTLSDKNLASILLKQKESRIGKLYRKVIKSFKKLLGIDGTLPPSFKGNMFGDIHTALKTIIRDQPSPDKTISTNNDLKAYSAMKNDQHTYRLLEHSSNLMLEHEAQNTAKRYQSTMQNLGYKFDDNSKYTFTNILAGLIPLSKNQGVKSIVSNISLGIRDIKELHKISSITGDHSELAKAVYLLSNKDLLDNLPETKIKSINDLSDKLDSKITGSVDKNLDKLNDLYASTLQDNELRTKYISNPYGSQSVLGRIASYPDSVIKSVTQKISRKITKKDLDEAAEDTKTKIIEKANGLIQGENIFAREMHSLAKDFAGEREITTRTSQAIRAVKGVTSSIDRIARNVLPTSLSKMFKNKLNKDQREAISRVIGMSEVYKHEDLVKNIMQKSDFSSLSKDEKLQADKIVNYKLSNKLSNDISLNPDNINKSKAKLIRRYITEEIIRKSNSDDLEHIRELQRNDPKGLKKLCEAQSVLNTKALTHISKKNSTNVHFGFLQDTNSLGEHYIVAPKKDVLKDKGYVLAKTITVPDGTKRYIYYSSGGFDAPFLAGAFMTPNFAVHGLNTLSGEHNFVTIHKDKKKLDIKGTVRVPFYDHEGKIKYYQYVLDPNEAKGFTKDHDIFNNISAYYARLNTKDAALSCNKMLLNTLKEQFDKDPNRDNYPNLFKSKDPAITYALGQMDAQTIKAIEETFGKANFFPVPKEMLADVVGYKRLSIGGNWNRSNIFSEKEINTTAKMLNNIFMGSEHAYKIATSIEKGVQSAIGVSKRIIVIGSGKIALRNSVAPVKQLIVRGVGLDDILKKYPEFSAKANQLLKNEARIAELKLLKQNDASKAEIMSLEASNKALGTVYDLYEKGFLTHNSGALVDANLYHIADGNGFNLIDKAVDKISFNALKKGAKYLTVAPDTALHQVMSKMTEYGDFLAKCVYYEHAMQQGYTPEQALRKTGDEFIDYAKLPGQIRDYGESMGLAWFFNNTIRGTKLGINILLENPLLGIVLSMQPPVDIYGALGAGIPVTDNLIWEGYTGQDFNKLGWHTIMGGYNMNPIHELYKAIF